MSYIFPCTVPADTLPFVHSSWANPRYTHLQTSKEKKQDGHFLAVLRKDRRHYEKKKTSPTTLTWLTPPLLRRLIPGILPEDLLSLILPPCALRFIITWRLSQSAKILPSFFPHPSGEAGGLGSSDDHINSSIPLQDLRSTTLEHKRFQVRQKGDQKFLRKLDQVEAGMKFSHSIQFNAVPDWSSHYIAYSGLKKLWVCPSNSSLHVGVHTSLLSQWLWVNRLPRVHYWQLYKAFTPWKSKPSGEIQKTQTQRDQCSSPIAQTPMLFSRKHSTMSFRR